MDNWPESWPSPTTCMERLCWSVLDWITPYSALGYQVLWGRREKKRGRERRKREDRKDNELCIIDA